jgi:hypothetical protein
MLIPNHPDEERLAALASHEPDATADARLTSHVDSCHRCTTVIDELGALRSALADLPDLAPARPLRLLPPVEEAPAPAAGGIGGWARRFFAPVLASGAALALVGMIGTAAPALSGPAGQAGSADSAQSAESEAAAEAPAAVASEPAADASEGSAAFDTEAGEEQPRSAMSDHVTTLEGQGYDMSASPPPEANAERDAESELQDEPIESRVAEEPSPWPFVLAAGVALMAGAVLIRYVLVPRAG